MKKRDAFGFIVVSVVFVSGVCHMWVGDNENNCNAETHFMQVGFDGVVRQKYLDKTQHSVQVFDITDAATGKVKQVSLFLERGGLHDAIQANDTLRKLEGANDVWIKVNGFSSF